MLHVLDLTLHCNSPSFYLVVKVFHILNLLHTSVLKVAFNQVGHASTCLAYSFFISFMRTLIIDHGHGNGFKYPYWILLARRILIPISHNGAMGWWIACHCNFIWTESSSPFCHINHISEVDGILYTKTPYVSCMADFLSYTSAMMRYVHKTPCMVIILIFAIWLFLEQDATKGSCITTPNDTLP